jgi:hypothetical protein
LGKSWAKVGQKLGKSEKLGSFENPFNLVLKGFRYNKNKVGQKLGKSEKLMPNSFSKVFNRLGRRGVVNDYYKYIYGQK